MSMTQEKEKITLGILRGEDMQALRELVTDGEIKKTYMLPDFDTPEAAEKLCLRLMALSREEGHFVRGIYLDDALIGFLNDVEQKDGRVEVGYVIHPRCWGRGYATKALQCAISQLFAQGFFAVRAGHFETNAASGRVMEKAGMKKISDTDEVTYRGQTHLCIYYEITA